MEYQLFFREDQRFRSPFLWIPLFGATAFCCGTILWMIGRQVIQDIPFGDDAMSNSQMLVLGGMVILLDVLFLLFMASLTLQTEVTTEGLFIRFKPIHRKTRRIDMEDVVSIGAVEYRPAMEYGGWGIRYGRNGRAYNVTGNLGVRIDYSNGYHLLIGTCYPQELEAALVAMMAAQGKEAVSSDDLPDENSDHGSDEA